MKNLNIARFASDDELAREVATRWLEICKPGSSQPVRSVALSGGRIARKFFAATVSQAQAKKISLEAIHFFWADERCVPPAHPESNFKMAQEGLFSPLKIP